MSAIRNVVIAGATGTLGPPVLKSLLDSQLFNITTLTRNTSDSQFPEPVKVVRVDYSSVSDLTAALTGQDAVVSLLGSKSEDAQLSLLGAAIVAGVKRFITSDFSSNYDNPNASTLPVYKTMIAFHKTIQQKVVENPKLTYTSVRNGLFFDWSLSHGFLVNLKGEPTPIYDGGNQTFTGTTLGSVAKAVVGVLMHPEETKNRPVFIKDVETSQYKLLAAAKKIAPNRDWSTKDVKTDDMEAKSREQYAAGNIDMLSSLGFFTRAIFAEGYGGALDGQDNELLGIKVKSDAEMEALLEKLLSGSS